MEYLLELALKAILSRGTSKDQFILQQLESIKYSEFTYSENVFFGDAHLSSPFKREPESCNFGCDYEYPGFSECGSFNCALFMPDIIFIEGCNLGGDHWPKKMDLDKMLIRFYY